MKWIEFLFLHTKSKTLSTRLIISIDSKDYNKTSFDSRNFHHKIEYLNPNKEFSRNDNYGKRGCRYRSLSTFDLHARPKIPKILTILQGAVETARLTWCSPFGHQSTWNVIFVQIDQNALSQPWVDQKSKLVKII